MSSEEEWVIDSVIGKRTRKSQKDSTVFEYLIRWEGYGEESDSWQTFEELDELGVDPSAAKEAIALFKPVKTHKPKPMKDEPPLWGLAQQKQNEAIEQQMQTQKALNQAQARERVAQEALIKAADQKAAMEREKQRQHDRATLESFLLELSSTIPSAEAKVKEIETALKKRTYERKKPTKGDIPSLWNISLVFICENLELYEGFEHVPVEWKAKMFGYLSRKGDLTVEKLRLIIDSNQKILNLTGCADSLSLKHIRALVRCPTLTKLVLKNCPTVHDLSFATIARCCPSLTHLDVSGSDHLQHPDLSLLSALSYLDISNSPVVGPAFRKLPLTTETLKAGVIRAEELIELFENRPRLRKIYFNAVVGSAYGKRHPETNDPSTPPSPIILHLTHLHLFLTGKTLWDVLFIEKPGYQSYRLPDLEELVCNQITLPIFPQLFSFPNLKVLKVTFTSHSTHSKKETITIPPLPSLLEEFGLVGPPLEDFHLGEFLSRPQVPKLKWLQIGLTDYFTAPLMVLLRLWRLNLSAESLDVTGWLGRMLPPDSQPFVRTTSDFWLLEWSHLAKCEAIQLNIHQGLRKIVLDEMQGLTTPILATLVNPHTTPVVEYLSMKNCPELTQFMDVIGSLKSLRVLRLTGFELDHLPAEPNRVQVLTIEDLKKNTIWGNLWKCFSDLRCLLVDAVPQAQQLLKTLKENPLYELGLASTLPMSNHEIKLSKRVSVLRLAQSRYHKALVEYADAKGRKHNWKIVSPTNFWDEKRFWPLKSHTHNK